ncbi:hypothetical protein JCM18903_848 [Psychrobacter sp. JCM 18903]|nr:hypothetical protein JCM18903_848 [Psychrobacter sp. JCM 18903]
MSDKKPNANSGKTTAKNANKKPTSGKVTKPYVLPVQPNRDKQAVRLKKNPLATVRLNCLID